MLIDILSLYLSFSCPPVEFADLLTSVELNVLKKSAEMVQLKVTVL